MASVSYAGLELDQVKENCYRPWGEKILERAKEIGMGDAYFYIFSLPSHAVHGNWQDILTHHVICHDDEFEPNTEWSMPRPQQLLFLIMLVSEVNNEYLDAILPDCEDKEKIKELLNDVFQRSQLVNTMHEEFLQKQ